MAYRLCTRGVNSLFSKTNLRLVQSQVSSYNHFPYRVHVCRFYAQVKLKLSLTLSLASAIFHRCQQLFSPSLLISLQFYFEYTYTGCTVFQLTITADSESEKLVAARKNSQF